MSRAEQGDEREGASAGRRGLAVNLRLVAKGLERGGPAVVGTDLGGRITYWNAGAERLLGWPAEAVLHQPVDVISSASDDGLSSDQLRRGLTRTE
ncbi:MAG: PAS domain-containing protein, partial [Acidimicrobiia bacterium]